MEKTIEKFKNYLEEELNCIKTKIQEEYYLHRIKNEMEYVDTESNREKIINKITLEYNSLGKDVKVEVIYVLLEYFNESEDESEKNYSLFDNYEVLSDLLNESNLNMKEKFEIVQYLLKRMLYRYNEHSIVINTDLFKGLLKNLKKLGLSTEEIKKFLYFNANNLLKADNDKLSVTQLILKYNLGKVMISQKTKEPCSIVFLIIKRHYIDKLNTYTETDAKITTKAFQILGIDKDLCEGFENLMKSEIRKRKEKAKEKVNLNKSNLVKEKEENKLSVKEHNKIYHEILNYYDIENHKIVKLLSLEEIIYIVSLLNKIKVSKNEIIKFIQNVNKAGLMTYDNPITEFNEYYNKMLLCNNYPEVKEALENILNYMQEIFIPDSEESYEFWKSEIEAEYKKIKKVLDRNYIYEYEEGMKKICN